MVVLCAGRCPPWPADGDVVWKRSGAVQGSDAGICALAAGMGARYRDGSLHAGKLSIFARIPALVPALYQVCMTCLSTHCHRGTRTRTARMSTRAAWRFRGVEAMSWRYNLDALAQRRLRAFRFLFGGRPAAAIVGCWNSVIIRMQSVRAEGHARTWFCG